MQRREGFSDGVLRTGFQKICTVAGLECQFATWYVFSGTEKGTPKNLCDKDFAELSGEFSAQNPLVSLGSALEFFRRLFGAVRVIFWLWGSFLAPDISRALLVYVCESGGLV